MARLKSAQRPTLWATGSRPRVGRRLHVRPSGTPRSPHHPRCGPRDCAPASTCLSTTASTPRRSSRRKPTGAIRPRLRRAVARRPGQAAAVAHHDPPTKDHAGAGPDPLAARRLPEAKAGRGRFLAHEVQTIDSAPPGACRCRASTRARFREVLGHFATGITIVTATEEGVPVGFSCQSFAALSLDPPMVVLAPAKSSTQLAPYRRAGAFCVNILGEHQEALC